MSEALTVGLLIASLYWVMALFCVIQGIVDLVRKGPGEYLASAVALAIMGGLLVPMTLFLKDGPVPSGAALTVAVILAMMAAWWTIAWVIGKPIQRRLFSSWERRRAAAEAAEAA